MKCRAAAPLILFLACTATAAQAQTLPAIKTGASNTVAACATPGRLMSFVKDRNGNLDDRFDGVATEYMRHGEALGVRWDFAFFQMLLETGNLSYRQGNGRPGDVRPAQHNFAGMGATGRGAPGESFPTVSLGVKAHLEHLLLYAGDYIPNPVAERTRKVQEWGVLTSWQRSMRGQVTFGNLSRKWAPGDRGYGSKVGAIAKAFYDNHCNRPDPRPELVAEARGTRMQQPVKAVAEAPPAQPKVSGADIARRAIEEARNESSAQRSSLGAAAIAKQTGDSISEQASTVPPAANQGQTIKTASAATGAATAIAPAPTSGCRVWTASYGGQKAIIIKSVNDGAVNFTVLDVNEGAEKRETEAYIAAYARGGQSVGEFANQSSALNKAFELCPEG